MTKLTYTQATKLVEQATQESLQNRDYQLVHKTLLFRAGIQALTV